MAQKTLSRIDDSRSLSEHFVQKIAYIANYGCASSQNDGEIIAGLLVKNGYEVTNDLKKADIFISNTCSVKSVTENKILYELKQIKNKRIIVAGCMAEAEPDKIRKVVPNATLVSTNHVADIINAIREEKDFTGKDVIQKAGLPKIRKNPVVDIVDIESGCSYNCAFCSTKLAKGNTNSYPKEKIIEQIKNARLDGCSEFWITGQDVADYDKRNLPELVKNITDSIRGRYFLRIGMIHPSTIFKNENKIIEMYNNEKVFKFLHLPAQSGSNSVLKKMKRANTVEQFEQIVNNVKNEIKDMTLWTDIIVGHPGETEEDFLQTIDLIKKIEPDVVNISAYALRPGTEAQKMKQIPTDVKKKRTQELAKLVQDISLKKNKKWINWEGDILIDEYNERNKNWVGRNYAYKPVAIKGDYKLGDFVNVRITNALKTCLIGEAL